MAAGVDLASQDANTAMAVVEWSASDARVVEVRTGVSNAAIVACAGQVGLVGIDCPLGYPAAFTDLVLASRNGTVAPDAGSTDGQRRSLAYRRTDLAARALTGGWPLSVSADRIGYPAMRAAGLLAAIRAGGRVVDRAGLHPESAVAEVYPAAALRRWRLTVNGPKKAPGAPAALLAALREAAPWLVFDADEERCQASHDALDAVICALVACAVQLGRTAPPDPNDQAAAAEEGWLHIPDEDFLRDPFRSSSDRSSGQAHAATPMAARPIGPASETTA